MKNVLLATASALALCAAVSTQASASVSGTLSASYADDTSSSGSNLWNIDGSLTGMFGSNWGGEIVGGYHNIDGGGANLDIWNVGGSLFWQHMSGRIAATVNYDSFSFSGIDVNQTSYGLGGEWYAGPNFTLAVKGGGETVDVSIGGLSADDSGGYVGGQLQWYAMPDLSISGGLDYEDVGGGHTTSENVKAEWLFSQSMPVSVYGGYKHVDAGAGSIFSTGSDEDILFVGLKFYMNGSGAMSLVDRQRNGSLGYIGKSPVFTDQF